MKKASILLMAHLVFGLLSIGATLTCEAHESIYVSIPDFPITVNDVQYNNTYSEYPFLVHNDITYIPMTYNLAEFMGINITFDKGTNQVYHKDEMILFIGSNDITSKELGQYLKENLNSDFYAAVIPDYHTYISFSKTEYDNNSLYPILNVKGITYIPLTWDVAHTLLDWDYSFDQKYGLRIDSTKVVRPSGVYKALFNRMGTSTREYVLGEHCYLIYDVDIYNSGHIVWATKDIYKEYSLQEQLKGKVNYLNRVYNSGSLVSADTPPQINDCILTILCARKDFGQENLSVKVDLNNGTVLQIDELA